MCYVYFLGKKNIILWSPMHAFHVKERFKDAPALLFKVRATHLVRDIMCHTAMPLRLSQWR